jgi:hypothetical protein
MVSNHKVIKNREVGNEINLLCLVEDSFITFWKLRKLKSLFKFYETSWKLEALFQAPIMKKTKNVILVILDMEKIHNR